MVISINPTITGGFVYHTLKDPAVSKFISELNLSREDAHNFVKTILIVGSRDLKIDFNKKVNIAVDKILDEQEQQQRSSEPSTL